MLATITKWMKEYSGRIAILCGVLVLIGSVGFYSECERFYLKDECVGGPMADGVRNIIIILAGIGAFYGLYVRAEGLKHEKKTKAEESISRAVKQMDSKSLPIRCVGVRLLQRIAEENSENEEVVTDALMDFVKNKRISKKLYEGVGEEDEPEPHYTDFIDTLAAREHTDIEVALRALGEIVSGERRENIVFEHLNLEALDLSRVNFEKFSFRRVSLSGSILRNANLHKSKFRMCWMHWTNLSGAQLQRADFFITEFNNAEFNNAIFEKTDCSFSEFSGNSLSGDHPDYIPGTSLTKTQADELIYYERFSPKFPNNWKPPKTNVYKKEVKDSRGRFRRQLLGGEWIDPA